MTRLQSESGIEAGNPTDVPVVVTVHGTNDHHPADDGERWWQRGSHFAEQLAATLRTRGVPAVEILPVHWSGMNSDFDRLRGASALARLLHRLEKAGRPHAVIAHSHGGNVTVEALARLGKAPARGGIVSFGTPFFIRRLKTMPWLIAIFQLVMGLVIAPIMIWYLVAVIGGGTSKLVEAAVGFGGLLLISVWSAISGVRKLAHGELATRRSRRGIGPGQWLVVHSPRDEAMRLLETAVEISPQYVTAGSAMRSLSAFARLAGVIGTIAFFAWTAGYFLTPLVTKVRAGELGLGTAADLTFLLLVPVVYGAIFGAVWLAARLGGAWLWAKVLTSAIHGGVVGAAYGGDADFLLTGVTRVPPYGIAAHEARLEAANLGGIDDEAIFVAAHKLYSSVVAETVEDGGLADPDAMWKHLSDALYHNAYMRDEGVIAAVADHLAANWKRA